MLKPNQWIKMNWHGRNKQYYVGLGYGFTKIGDEFHIRAEDLPNGSHKKIAVICDYCGDIVHKTYKDYKRHNIINMDCCAKCQKLKSKDTCNAKYGVDNVFQLDEIKDKTHNTIIEKYGYDGNIAHAPEIADKIKQTNMEKYGVEYSAQAPEVIAKMRKSLYENGNVPSSKAERYICNLLADIYGFDNCHPNYAIDRINLDCLLTIDDCMIDVEYDGWYWHKNKQEYDKRRNYYLIDRGYKVLRIKSMNELPTRQQLIDAIDYLVKGNHSWTEIILDIR